MRVLHVVHAMPPLRGGSWFSLPPALPWTRAQEVPGHRSSCFGFRPACRKQLLRR